MRWKVIPSLLLVVTLLLPAGPAMAAPTVSDLSKALICQCGCTLTLAGCNHGECHSRDLMLGQVKDLVSKGQSTDQILAFFVAQYGEQVLASPPKKGFNLVAWILPFAAILLGAYVVYILVKKWALRGQESQALVVTENDDSPETYEEYRQRLARELKDFEGGAFR